MVIRSAFSTRFQLARTRRRVKNASGEKGTELLEFTLSAALLLTMLFGIIELGLACYTFHYVSDAAREGTRYAIVRGSSCTTFATACPANTTTDIQNYVKGLNFVDPSAMTVTPSWPTTGVTCTPSATPCNNPGNLVKVTVQYAFPLRIPFVPSRSLTLTSSSQMVISQ
jgi:Flp pilus assembly protein TadG